MHALNWNHCSHIGKAVNYCIPWIALDRVQLSADDHITTEIAIIWQCKANDTCGTLGLHLSTYIFFYKHIL